MINKPVTLYLGRSPLPVYVNVSQFDTMWAFQYSIIYAGQPWTIPSGANVILNGRKPDGNVFAFSGTVADNVATVNADVQMTAVAGLVECELSILASGKVVGTANFTLAVEAAPKSPSDISSESTLPAYAELLEVAAGLPDNIPQYITDWLDEHPEATTTVQDGAITEAKLNTALLDALTIQQNASGPIASFADGAALPVKDLVAQIVAQQSGSGAPSPTNIRPISGFTGASAYLYDADGNYQTDDSFAIIQQPQNQEASAGADDVSFSIVVKGTGVAYQWQVFNPSVGSWANSGSSGNKSATLNVGVINAARVTYRYRCLVSKGGVTLTSAPAMMYYTGTPEPDVVVDYEADYAPLVSVNWQTEAGTIAGGYLDVTTGLLTVTYGYMSFDGTEAWIVAGSGNSRLFRHTVVGERINPTGRLCSHYRSVTVTTGDSSVGYFSYSQDDSLNGNIQFRPENVANMTIDDWKNWLAEQSSNGTPVQVTYKHETPVTYQLTPTEVATLLGQNNIWANTGDIAVTYRADPSLVIAALESRINATQNIIAGVENAMVATKNYSIGDLLIAGDALYKATAAIANGGAITVGTNVASTTVAEQLLLLANK